MDRPSTQRRQGERRRLFDRRAPMARRGSDDRRLHERRASDSAPGGDRRRGERRSIGDRRAAAPRRRGRRRRDTPTPYTAEQVADLRARFAAPGLVLCPACEGRFTLGPGRRRGPEVARRVVCIGCGRGAMVPHSHAARILVIAQPRTVRETLHTILVPAGHEVVEADDAAVGLVAYQMVPADLVILDVTATGRVTAPEFLRRLRRSFPEARVVAMAGRPSWTGVDPLAVVQGLGAVRSVRLPVTGEALLRIVDDARQ